MQSPGSRDLRHSHLRLGVVAIALGLLTVGCSTTGSADQAPSRDTASVAGISPSDTSPVPGYCAAGDAYLAELAALSAARQSGREIDWVSSLRRVSAAAGSVSAVVGENVPSEVEAALTTQTSALGGMLAEGAAKPAPTEQQLGEFDASSQVIADYLDGTCVG